MKAVIQRVLSSAVSVNGETIGAIGQGFNILLGVMDGDTEQEATQLAAIVAPLPIGSTRPEETDMKSVA